MKNFTVINSIRINHAHCKYAIESVEVKGIPTQGCRHPRNKGITCNYEQCPKKSKEIVPDGYFV